MLRGEPGIGKSRLLSEAARHARERGMVVLSVTGVQSEAKLPFAGLHQLLRPVRERAVELPAIQPIGRCCSSWRTRIGSIARARTCSRSSPGESNPIQSSGWPLPVTGYPPGLTDAGLPEHRITGLDDATSGALLDAIAPRLPLATRGDVMQEAAGNPLALLELPAVIGRPEDGTLQLVECR